MAARLAPTEVRSAHQRLHHFVADAGYGVDTAFRDQLSARGLQYCVGVTSVVSVWPEGQARLPPAPWPGNGRKPRLLRRDAQHQPVSVKALALSLSARQWENVTWWEGINEALESRFAAVCVRCACRDQSRSTPRPEQWLLIEWPKDEPEPIKYFFCTLPADTALGELVRVTKLRWRIERDYQELKQGFGLDHFEGRGWRGFHHHATLPIAAYGFLLAERLAHPEKNCATSGSGRNRCPTRELPAPGRPCEPSATYRTRSQPCAWSSPQR